MIYFITLKYFCDTVVSSFGVVISGILMSFSFWAIQILLQGYNGVKTSNREDDFIVISSIIFIVLTCFTLYQGEICYHTKQWRPIFKERIAQIEAGKVSYALSPKVPSDKIYDYLKSNKPVFARQIMDDGQLKEISLNAISSIVPFKVIGKENIKNVPYQKAHMDADKDVLFLCHIVNYSVDGAQRMDVVMGSNSYSKAIKEIRKVNAKIDHDTDALQGLSQDEKTALNKEDEQIKLMISKEKN